MIRYAIVLAALLATPAFAAPPAAAPMTAWDAKADGDPKVYHMQGLTLTLSSGKDTDDDLVPELTVASPGGKLTVFDGEPAGFDHAMASFGTGRFDPKAPAPQIELASFTGGAHCCAGISVIERDTKGWKEVSLGEWDGDVPENMPTDVDGDGTPDFIFVDNNFLYAFDSYAASWAPPKILSVIGGKVVDVSANPKFHKVFAGDMARVVKDCTQKQNGACASYVADAARLGQFGAAWKFMLAHYDAKADWDYPTRCIGTMTSDDNCKGNELKPRDYPQALRWFLEDHHYIPKQAGD
jgi:hypothetical protein